MQWTSLFTLATLASLASAELRKHYWQAETTYANSTELVQCMNEMKAMLEAKPKANHLEPYQCGNHSWQVGSTANWQPIHTNLKGFRKCEKDLSNAAYAGRDWFQCHASDLFGYRVVAYSPLGLEACLHKKPINHAPCKEGVWVMIPVICVLGLC
ncbi:unnamed protein product [Cercospora beticola]|nr:unnamed protein product [Cercospora beticola]